MLIALDNYRVGEDYFMRWWPISESNQGHSDFQSLALPTELIGHLLEAESIDKSYLNKT
jgi:hypothetical protein